MVDDIRWRLFSADYSSRSAGLCEKFEPAADKKASYPSLTPGILDLLNIMECLPSEKLCSLLGKNLEDSALLDLGSAYGETVATLSSYYRMRGYGIDMRRAAVNISNTIFDHLGLSCKAYCGNFFPADYPVSQDIKWGKSIRPEAENIDTYSVMGRNLRDFDVITFYQYFKNMPDIFDLLSQRCRPGALVLALGFNPFSLPEDLEGKIPDNLQVLDVGQKWFALYRVTSAVD